MVAQEHPDGVTLVADGHPTGAIQLPADESEAERFAAAELQSYLTKMSGATVPIGAGTALDTSARVQIGATFLDEDRQEILEAGDADAFAVSQTDGTVMLGGTTERATVYAVYDLLERAFGCRWLGPGPDWEEIPTVETVAVPGELAYTDEPGMTYRSLSLNQSFEMSTWRGQCTDWSVKRKLNTGYGKFNFDEGAIPEELPAPARRRGGFRAWETTHLTGALIDPREYFDDHPDWFALVDGERHRAPDDRRHFQQFCTTNPELIDEVAAKLGDLFDAHPSFEFLPITQGDGTAFCECADCQALDGADEWHAGDANRRKARPTVGEPSDRTRPVLTERWLTFVNEVARRLQETHPEKQVYTLAYHQTFRPPDPADITPEPNVMVRVVNSRPNYLCFIHRLDREDCPHHERFRDGLEEWASLTPGGVTGYFYMPHSTFCSVPFVAARKFAADVRYLDDVGLVGFYGQCSPNTWGVYGLTRYVTAKALWDPERDVDALIQEYCDAAFQEASEHMRAFYDVLEDRRAAGEHITEGIWSAFDDEALASARAHLDDAHEAAEQERVTRRLRQIEVGFRYGELAYDAWSTAYPAIAADDPDALRNAIATAERAVDYLDGERAERPHHAAVAGKLERVHLARWEDELARMESTAES